MTECWSNGVGGRAGPEPSSKLMTVSSERCIPESPCVSTRRDVHPNGTSRLPGPPSPSSTTPMITPDLPRGGTHRTLWPPACRHVSNMTASGGSQNSSGSSSTGRWRNQEPAQMTSCSAGRCRGGCARLHVVPGETPPAAAPDEPPRGSQCDQIPTPASSSRSSGRRV